MKCYSIYSSNIKIVDDKFVIDDVNEFPSSEERDIYEFQLDDINDLACFCSNKQKLLIEVQKCLDKFNANDYIKVCNVFVLKKDIVMIPAVALVRDQFHGHFTGVFVSVETQKEIGNFYNMPEATKQYEEKMKNENLAR